MGTTSRHYSNDTKSNECYIRGVSRATGGKREENKQGYGPGSRAVGTEKHVGGRS